MLDTALSILGSFWGEVSPKLLTLFGLILLDVLMGIARAVHQGQFEWKKVGQFYKSMVLPYIIGWLAVSLTIWMISLEMLPAEVSVWLNPALLWTTWLVVAATIGGSIKENVVALYQARLDLINMAQNSKAQG
jgi:phosphatidylglycerophosphate synthase